MKKSFLATVVLSVIAATVMVSCMKEGQYEMDGRQVKVVLTGFDDFGQDGTKGRLLSSGQYVWGQSESRINTWAVGLYSSGYLCSWDYGSYGSPSPSVPLPEEGDLKVFAVVNMPGFEFPGTFDECLDYVFEFDPEQLERHGVPACGWTAIPEDSETVSIILERMVAKIVFTLDKGAYQSFAATEISLHDVALDSDSGSVAGYMSSGFDTATSAELESVNAGNGGEIVFICPENLKGTVPGITSPYRKVPPAAPAHSTFIEVRGVVSDSDFGSGELVYRFYVGADNTSDFNVGRNRVYHVSLVLNESMMEGYRDGGYWKVDTEGFEYDDVRFVWLKGSSQSNTCTISEGETGRLMIHLPGYMDKENTIIGLMVGDECCGYGDWNQESYLDCRESLNDGIDYQSSDFGLDFIAPVEFREKACRNIPTLSAGDDAPSSDWDYFSRDFPGATAVQGPCGLQEVIFSLSRIGNGPGMPVPDGFSGWYMMDIGNSVDCESAPVAVFVYYGQNEETYAFPVFHEASSLPHFDMGMRDPDQLYIGENVPVSVMDNTVNPVWTVVSGAECISLSSGTGNSNSLVCKKEGSARIRCDAKPGYPLTMDIKVRKPALFSWYRWWHDSYAYRSALAHGENAENGLVEEGAYDLTFDGRPNNNVGWWYVDESGERIEYTDAEVFETYVGAVTSFVPTLPGTVDFETKSCGYREGLFLASYGTSAGQYALVQGNDRRNDREKLGEMTFRDLLGNEEVWPVYTLFRSFGSPRIGNYRYMQGALPSSSEALAAATAADLVEGDMAGCCIWNLDSHFEVSGGKLRVKASVLDSDPEFKGTFGANFGVYNSHSGKIYGKTGSIEVYLNLGLVLKAKRTMVHVSVDAGHKPSVGLAPCWYNPNGDGTPPDVPSGEGLLGWSSRDLDGGSTASWFNKRTWTKYSVQTHADPESPAGVILYPYVENIKYVPDSFARRPWTFAIPTHVLIDSPMNLGVVRDRYPFVNFYNGEAVLGNIVFVERDTPVCYLRKGGDSNGLYPDSILIEDGHYVLHNMTRRLEYDPVFESR